MFSRAYVGAEVGEEAVEGAADIPLPQLLNAVSRHMTESQAGDCKTRTKLVSFVAGMQRLMAEWVTSLPQDVPMVDVDEDAAKAQREAQQEAARQQRQQQQDAAAAAAAAAAATAAAAAAAAAADPAAALLQQQQQQEEAERAAELARARAAEEAARCEGEEKKKKAAAANGRPHRSRSPVPRGSAQ